MSNGQSCPVCIFIQACWKDTSKVQCMAKLWWQFWRNWKVYSTRLQSIHFTVIQASLKLCKQKQSIEMAITRHLPAYCRSECFGKKDFLRYCGHSRYCRIRARSRLALVLFPEALRFSVFPDSLKTTISSTLKTTRARAICRKRMRIEHTSQWKVWHPLCLFFNNLMVNISCSPFWSFG